MPSVNPSWSSAADLARLLGVDKKTIHNRARAESWPARQNGNRFEYQYGNDNSSPSLPSCPSVKSESEIRVQCPSAVSFHELANEPARALALQREQAVLHYDSLIASSLGKELALAKTVSYFCSPPISVNSCPSVVSFSSRTLRRWIELYRLFGLNGLADQRQGRVGRKPVAASLTSAQIIRGKALATDFGVSRAARVLQSDPDLGADAREHLHSAHAGKSYVTPSIRAALKSSDLTKSLLQGPRTARLAGRFTPRDYSDLKAGEIFTSDDMTSNVLCWTEWPNARGWRLGQPQILPVMDVASLRWLNVRVIMRDSGQYTADDIWGLFGDVFDTFGLPARGFLLEGGHWQSNKVKGFKTGLTNQERIGGLNSLGLRIWRSYDPRSKGMLEGAFNHFQSEMDSFPGFTGREQRYDLPETVKKQRALCEGGHAHPRQYFAHLSQFADHVQQSFERLNHERQDGQILRGQSPLEKWAEHSPRLSELPETAKWMYRSAKSVSRVTRNGIRVITGSGPSQVIYYWDNPELLVPRQGSSVMVYWNDKNPDADAAVLDLATRTYIGTAKRVQPLSAFNATPAQLDAEAARKRAAMTYARTELRSMQPDLARRQPLSDSLSSGERAGVRGSDSGEGRGEGSPIRVHQCPSVVDPSVGESLRASASRADQRDRADAALRRVTVTAEDLAAMNDHSHPSDTSHSSHRSYSADEIADALR